jgi:hypothetical protein
MEVINAFANNTTLLIELDMEFGIGSNDYECIRKEVKEN